MANILHLLKRRRAERVSLTAASNGDIVVDLTDDSCEDAASGPADVLRRFNMESSLSVACPVCQLNITALEIAERETHVEQCLTPDSDRPSAKSPKSVAKASPASTEPKPKRPKKPLPYFKVLDLPPYKVIVDGFCYAEGPSERYFLSHFHSDHYVGVTKSWSQGTIYASEITAQLVIKELRVREDRVVIIPMHERWQVCEGLWVTLEDANHCPGAVVFLFESEHEDQMKRVLHTGDFRVSQQLIERFKDVYLDEIYLDTTYLDPHYTFYDQRLVVSATVKFVQRCVANRKPGILQYVKGTTDTVILVGSYSIGKEKLYVELARALKTKIFVSAKRYEMLSLSGQDMSLFEHKEESKCTIYVVHFGKLTDKPWLRRFSHRNIIMIRPTGWAFSRMMGKQQKEKEDHSEDRYTDTVTKSFNQYQPKDLFEEQLRLQWQRGNTLQVPYSEHSSFKELSLFGTMLNWGKMIPTVSVDNQEYPRWFQAWKSLVIDDSVAENHFTS